MLKIFSDMEQTWAFRNICNLTLNAVHNQWDYATSRLFIILPSDLNSWEDSDPSTHTFRLYFICDMKKQRELRERTPPHVHLSNHPGYNLNQPHDFFQVYGDYALRVLRMVKHGYTNKSYEIPPLSSCKILWHCNTNISSRHLSKENIGPLIDKAISYLDELHLPRSMQELELTRASSAAIKAYLDVQDGDNGQGDLHCYIDPQQKMTWMCREHTHQGYLNQERLEELKAFVGLRGGHLDMQQATLRVELGSTSEADQFLDVLTTTKHIFNIAIKLGWRAEQQYLEELCQKISWTGTVVLEVDGVTLDTQPFGPIQHKATMAQSKSTASIRLVSLLNYPRPGEQCLFMESCEVQLSSSSAKSDYDWVEVQRAVVKFGETVADPDITRAQCKSAALRLRVALANHGLSDVQAITVYNDRWNGIFSLQEGAFVEMNSFNMEFPKVVVASKRLRKMTVLLLEAETDQALYDMAQTHGLEELGISTHGRNVLDQIKHLACLWRNTSVPRRHTLLEFTKDSRQRVVAEIVIRGRNNSSTGKRAVDHQPSFVRKSRQDDLVEFDFLQWDCDHFVSPLSTYFASFLDLATQKYPSVLTMFTLNTSSLSRNGLADIQKVLRRSSLESINVVCTFVHPDLSDIIAQVLGTVQWSTLKSLVLCGPSIDQWIQLWPRTVDARLLNFNIIGSGSSPQELTHASVLFVHQITYANPQTELVLQNVQPQDKRDWSLIVDSMDPSFQGSFNP
ncbi:hypothetical protein MVEG_10370 [Podila verticillata NRRL 6337]|nr:hypothetical protein MVEG_10370 [Podila verticillata NRRL 6337]